MARERASQAVASDTTAVVVSVGPAVTGVRVVMQGLDGEREIEMLGSLGSF